MRIAIIGAGIAGVTSAYELAADGHEVCVFERRGSVAGEASFANSGIVVPGLALPWTRTAFSLFDGRQRERWKAQRDKALPERQLRLLKLAQFSFERLQALRRSLQLDYERSEGQLVLLRTAKDQAAIEPGLALLEQAGISARPLDADQCRAAEPGLNTETPLHGGVLLPQAEAGNCRQLAHQLRGEAQRLGVQFRFHTTVRSVEPGSPVRLTHEYTPPTELTPARSAADGGDTLPAEMGPQVQGFDAVLVCAAQDATALLKPLKLNLPVSAGQSMSITAPLRQIEAHPDFGPRGALLDQQSGVQLSRIGQRVRAVGLVDEKLLHKTFDDWFPGALVAGQAQRWQGAHAELADGLPVLGNSGLSGIWLNLGHGDSGFTLACGAARVLAEQIARLAPELDVAGLDITRFA
ncbi:FAD-dependent oxidoreductase [Pelomonas sp. KK5]|uniref:FAD-dependent oxidoreductase n=1 Tax=Pelomonas sp. KK5 TaxID=1855730 RepID=UPI00097C0864|nr:FAD-dependent oxidoreductase [Pelomonas sp. KK5]